jgi:hypothetical protein
MIGRLIITAADIVSPGVQRPEHKSDILFTAEGKYRKNLPQFIVYAFKAWFEDTDYRTLITY